MNKIIMLPIIFILVSLLISCTPQTPVSPTQTPSTPAPISIPTSNLSLPTSQDTAWQKVLEAAKKEGRFLIYSSNFTGDIGIATSNTFKERYGIQMEIITGRGADFIERLKTERRMGGILADLSDTNAPNGKLMKEQGLTARIADELPVLREKDVWAIDILRVDPQDRHLVNFTLSVYTPYVNTNLIKPGEEPKEWKDYLEPKWKGKLVAVNPTTSAGLLQQFVPLMREKVIDEDFLKSLYKQDLRFSSTLEDEAIIVSRGERSVSISGNTTSFSKYINEGAPMRAVEFSHGVMLGAIVVAFNGSPHPNAAKVFINWLLSAEGQTIWGKANSVASVRKDVPNFLPQASRVTPKKFIFSTTEDVDESAKLFREQWLNKLWGRN